MSASNEGWCERRARWVRLRIGEVGKGAGDIS